MGKATSYIPGQKGEAAVQQQLSLCQQLNYGIEFAYPLTRDINSWANGFSAANIQGAMVRVSALGATPPAGSVNWTATNTKIPHNLGRIPMGWLITYKSKACDIFAGTTAPDAQFIYLTITDDTAETNLFIF